jgi:hypothetical protein
LNTEIVEALTCFFRRLFVLPYRETPVKNQKNEIQSVGRQVADDEKQLHQLTTPLAQVFGTLHDNYIIDSMMNWTTQS